MQILLSEIQREWSLRIVHAFVGFAVFVIIGYLIPKTYYQYFDHRQYLTVVQPVTYNKKEFAPGEKAVAVISYRAMIDMKVQIRTKTYKVEEDGFRLIKESPPAGKPPTETFVARTGPLGSKQVTEAIVPKDFGEGTYFYEAFVTYKVHGVEHSYSFVSTQVGIK